MKLKGLSTEGIEKLAKIITAQGDAAVQDKDAVYRTQELGSMLDDALFAFFTEYGIEPSGGLGQELIENWNAHKEEFLTYFHDTMLRTFSL